MINCARFDDVSERDVRLRHGKGRENVLHLSVTMVRFGMMIAIQYPREMKVFPWPLRR